MGHNLCLAGLGLCMYQARLVPNITMFETPPPH